jgi:hypothetical protein
MRLFLATTIDFGATGVYVKLVNVRDMLRLLPERASANFLGGSSA